MQSARAAGNKASDSRTNDHLRGKATAMTVYILFLSGIMMLFTAAIGVLVAHLRRGKVASWVDTHLQFQIHTFWPGLPVLAAGLLLAWNLAGYLIITAWLMWAVGRCGVGIHRLMNNHPIEAPRSVWFGGTRISLVDRPTTQASRAGSVTALAWMFIVAASATLALTGLHLLSGEAVSAAFADRSAGGLSAGVAWLFERSRMLMWLLLAGALITLWLAIALLRRRPWARQAFLVLLACGFVATVGSAAVTPMVFALLPYETAAAINPDQPLAGLVGLLALLIVTATALTALFAWAGWKLTRPAVRAEFGDPPLEAKH